jgi:hypothetical protein
VDAGAPGTCPPAAQAAPYLNSSCTTIVGNGTFTNGLCCYEVQASCGFTGRPWIEAGLPRSAPLGRASNEDARSWSNSRSLVPSLHGSSEDHRRMLADAWARDGLGEHASVASFGRFALELLAVGAPADLVAEAHRAALDEVHHARLCLGLASAYLGEPLAPAQFPFDGRVDISADLADIAARAVREGCIGETLGAIQAAEQLAVAEDPAVRVALSVIVEDEARHAELAWRFVAWAIAEGGEPVRAAVAAAFADPAIVPAGDAPMPPEVMAHGRVSAASLRAAFARAIEDVVLPCARNLLAPAML